MRRRALARVLSRERDVAPYPPCADRDDEQNYRVRNIESHRTEPPSLCNPGFAYRPRPRTCLRADGGTGGGAGWWKKKYPTAIAAIAIQGQSRLSRSFFIRCVREIRASRIRASLYRDRANCVSHAFFDRGRSLA